MVYYIRMGRLLLESRQQLTYHSHSREDASDKLKSNLKPDSEKSTVELAQEKAKGAADSVAGTLQPGKP